MKSRTERQHSAGTQAEAALPHSSASKRGYTRRSTRRCELTRSRFLKEEVDRQVAEAAQEIVRASVEKAKAGSLSHTKWLCSLVERQREADPSLADQVQPSLAEILMQELRSKQ